MKPVKPFDPVALSGEQHAALCRYLRETISLVLPPGKRAAMDADASLLWPAAFGEAFAFQPCKDPA